MVASPGHPELSVEREKKCLKSVVLTRRLLQ